MNKPALVLDLVKYGETYCENGICTLCDKFVSNFRRKLQRKTPKNITVRVFTKPVSKSECIYLMKIPNQFRNIISWSRQGKLNTIENYLDINYHYMFQNAVEHLWRALNLPPNVIVPVYITIGETKKKKS